jgi:type I restriction enzyme M protein
MNSKEILREIRNYLAGQFVGATRDESILTEIIKCLFVHHHLSISQENYPFGEGRDIDAAKYFRKLFKKIVSSYPEFFDKDDEFLLGTEDLDWTLRKLWPLKLENSSSDIIGDAFEIFIGSALRGQEGQFFTPRNAIRFLIDAVKPSANEVIIDPACGTGGFLSILLQYFHKNNKVSKPFHVYGIDKDAFLARLAKIHIALLGGDYSKIINTDSIAVHNGLNDPNLPPEGEYDVVLTNPPFGAKIISAKPKIAMRYNLAMKWKFDNESQQWLQTDELRKKIPPQLLFLEKCVKLLRPGGRCGIVVPESLISSKQYRFVVAYLEENTNIEIIAGMPEALFKTSGKGGTHTKTCLILFRKKKDLRIRQSSPIFLAEAQWCGNDSRGRVIDKDDLPEIIKNYFTFIGDNQLNEDILGFTIKPKDIEDYSLCPRRYDPNLRNTISELENTHEIFKFGDLVSSGILELSSGDEIGKLVYGSGKIPFIRTSDISNWEIKADPKHSVDESIYNSLKRKQDVQENDILIVKDGTYLIGTCAIVTKHDLKILYQSHLYKIRVLKDTKYLNPYLLLAVLSSEIVQSQIKSKRVTHDIIDSLGTRINELMLPIPKDKDRREIITNNVKKAIQKRIEAKELARKANELIMNKEIINISQFPLIQNILQ